MNFCYAVQPTRRLKNELKFWKRFSRKLRVPSFPAAAALPRLHEQKVHQRAALFRQFQRMHKSSAVLISVSVQHLKAFTKVIFNFFKFLFISSLCFYKMKTFQIVQFLRL